MIKKTFIRIYDTDIGYSFFNSKIAIISSSVFFIILICSFFAGIVAPYNPFDPASVSLMDAFTPPIWSEGWNTSFLLGTDQQGWDIFSTMIYGSRISIIVGFASLILTFENPLPQSNIIWTFSVRISTQGVEPTYLIVKGPEVGIDPLTPWLIIIKFPLDTMILYTKKKVAFKVHGIMLSLIL